VNLTDGDLVTEGAIGSYSIPFSSGGTTEIAIGDIITGATSAATGVVSQVLLSSGSWAGGDAAGFFIVDFDELTGTFGSENVNTPNGDNLATVTVNVTINWATAAAVAAATGTSALAPYAGTEAATSAGFTIGSVVAEEAKLLFWEAWRS